MEITREYNISKSQALSKFYEMIEKDYDVKIKEHIKSWKSLFFSECEANFSDSLIVKPQPKDNKLFSSFSITGIYFDQSSH